MVHINKLQFKIKIITYLRTNWHIYPLIMLQIRMLGTQCFWSIAWSFQLLFQVARPEDITARYTSNDDKYFKWWYYADYKFTVTILWSPFLVKSSQTYLNDTSFSNAENLYVDEADKAWASHIENFDYVIFSGGQWFFRPLTFYENGHVVGCQKCHNLMEDPLNLYGYRHAFRTAFRTVINLKGFKGMVFMVSHSPNHFENGEWNKGGGCNRTLVWRSFTRHKWRNSQLQRERFAFRVDQYNCRYAYEIS